MITERYLDGTYLAQVPDWHAGDSLWKAAKVLQMIRQNDLFVKSVHDVGCGAGMVLTELQRSMDPGAQFTGFDISPQAIAMAAANQNERLLFYHCDYLESSFPPADLLLVLDVFEHIPDYLGFLDALRRRAACVIFHIPLDFCAKAAVRYSNWMLYMRKKYGHLHYFTKETALATLSDAGYQVIDCFYTDDVEINGVQPAGIRSKLLYRLRSVLFRLRPGLAASIFPSFNLMVLALGDLGGGAYRKRFTPSVLRESA